MTSLTVVLHYRRTASYGLNVLLGALEQELGAGSPGSRIAVVAASGAVAVAEAVGSAGAAGRRVLVAWSFYSPEAATVADELRRLRGGTSPGGEGAVVHLAGGVHASAEPAATLAMGFDLVAVGEGEATFVDAVRALADGAGVADLAGTVAGLVDPSGRRLAPAPRHPLGRYPAFAAVHGRYNPIEITRGCVYGCTFCQTPYQFKARFRHRPVDDVARHAGLLVASGRRDVRFVTPTALSYGSDGEHVDLDAVDDLLGAVRAAAGRHARIFFGTFPSEVRPEHVSPAALAIIRRHCDNDNLVIGGQSGSEAVLRRTNRGHGVDVIVEAVRHTLAAGLQPNVDLLFGLPEETPADAEASLALARRLAELGARVHGHTFMPLPGTPLRDAPAGTLDAATRTRLDRLASDGALYGSWRRQEQVAARLVELRPTRRRANRYGGPTHEGRNGGAPMDVQLELLAWGYGLVEGPRTDADDNLYFTDIPGRGVYRRSPDGTIETLISGRHSVGGLVLHADGGFVLSGPNVAHWRDGELRVLLEVPGAKAFNDIHSDAQGRIYAGTICSDLEDLKGPKTPGTCYRINLDGSIDELYGGIEVTNGIGFSPDGATMYHVDSTSKGIWVHDMAADGSVSNRRHIGRASFERGIPDGMCVDADGNLWVAHVGGRRAVKLSPTGEELDEIRVPAKWVTSVAFGGPDWGDLYLVTADDLEQPERKGGIYRCRPGVTGLPTPLARV